jgi:hypothetical protein
MEAAFVDTNTYPSGNCTALPGFTLSGGVTCSTSGGAAAFSVTASHSSVPGYSCTWTSNPGAGVANLGCTTTASS